MSILNPGFKTVSTVLNFSNVQIYKLNIYKLIRILTFIVFLQNPGSHFQAGYGIVQDDIKE